ncbi:MAG TPA: hypothetical protein VFZ72_14735 [Jiangellaceae bacterium]
MEHSVPCYRCGARQTDPVRGTSPWRRGVRADEQVLVCPDCQQNSSWLDDLDRCPVCGSTALFRRLGATVCRECEDRRLAPVGASRTTASGTAGATPIAGVGAPEEAQPASIGSPTPARQGQGDHELAREVAAAIDRVLGRA